MSDLSQSLQESSNPRAHETVYAVRPDLSWGAIKHYAETRLITLQPSLSRENVRILNPIPPLRIISRKTWLFILVAFLGWTWDAFDFFSVSLTAPQIAKTFDKKPSDITWGITLVLMLRSVGAVIFGVASDRYGRKWTFIINLVCFIAIELGTGFVQTYKQFLGVRALFGVAMGGLYGNAAATALEDCPVEARGLISGLLQQGYAFGYLLVVCFNRALSDVEPHRWRNLFWFGAGPPVLIILFRMWLPETDTYLLESRLDKEHLGGRTFMKQAKQAFRDYWLIFIYLILLMAGMNFCSHGSQDNYTVFLTIQLGYGIDRSTVTNSVANLGALAGGITMGHMSQLLGRRLTLIICSIIGGALVYPWVYVRNSGINASAFFLQFMVQGAWGVIPIYLSELSPPRFRSFLVGVSYQLGNLCSSASSTIETRLGERFPLKDAQGHPIESKYDYGKVMAIFMGCVFAYMILIAFVGPEFKSRSLATLNVVADEKAHNEMIEDQDDYENHEAAAGYTANRSIV